MRIFANANYDFIGRRGLFVKVSVAVCAALVVGMIALQFSAGSWMNYGVDFTGGTMVQVIAPQGATAESIREIASRVSPGATVSRFGAESEFLIRVPEFVEEGAGEESVANEIVAALQAEYGGDGVQVVRTEAVGARVGSELQRQAAFAILLSFAVTLLYLAFRFEWRFGVAAIVSTFHDILVVLGVISIFRLEVSLTTVAAVLTIIGYSLNDTIVVFDRVRENVAKLGRRETYEKIVNTAINEIPADADIVVTQNTLTDRARAKAPQAEHISIGNFIQAPEYDELVERLRK